MDDAVFPARQGSNAVAAPRETIGGFSAVGGLRIDTILTADGEIITRRKRSAGTRSGSLSGGGRSDPSRAMPVVAAGRWDV